MSHHSTKSKSLHDKKIIQEQSWTSKNDKDMISSSTILAPFGLCLFVNGVDSEKKLDLRAA